MERVENIMGTIVTAFEKQLDALMRRADIAGDRFSDKAAIDFIQIGFIR